MLKRYVMCIDSMGVLFYFFFCYVLELIVAKLLLVQVSLFNVEVSFHKFYFVSLRQLTLIIVWLWTALGERGVYLNYRFWTKIRNYLVVERVKNSSLKFLLIKILNSSPYNSIFCLFHRLMDPKSYAFYFNKNK